MVLCTTSLEMIWGNRLALLADLDPSKNTLGYATGQINIVLLFTVKTLKGRYPYKDNKIFCQDPQFNPRSRISQSFGSVDRRRLHESPKCTPKKQVSNLSPSNLVAHWATKLLTEFSTMFQQQLPRFSHNLEIILTNYI